MGLLTFHHHNFVLCPLIVANNVSETIILLHVRFWLVAETLQVSETIGKIKKWQNLLSWG